MRANWPVRIVLIALSCVVPGIGVAQSVPIVYEDAYVTVHAGIVESGMQAVHIGDPLSLIVDVTFDADIVQVENLNDDVFQRAFGGMPGVRLYAPATTAMLEVGKREVRISTQWTLQFIDCPVDMTICPGSKLYELPVMTIAYQLTSDTGGSPDSRSARFRPWPGSLAIASALAVTPAAGVDLAEVLPGGAFDDPQPVAELAPSRSLLLLAGAILFAIGFVANGRARRPQSLALRAHDSGRRWEQAIVELRDDSMPDNEWSDLLRRSLTWYCMDELDMNPYEWIGSAASDAATNPAPEARALFLDVLQQHSIEPQGRSKYVSRLLDLTTPDRGARDH